MKAQSIRGAYCIISFAWRLRRKWYGDVPQSYMLHYGQNDPVYIKLYSVDAVYFLSIEF